MGYIYKITNDINHKVYIGQTRCSIEERWKGHQQQVARGDGAKLQRAIREYGIEHFSISMIEECDNERLDEREIYWIDHYNSYDNGYNANRGGASKSRFRIALIVNDSIVKIYNNYHEAAQDAHCMRQRISDVVNGRRNSANGMVFRKLDKNNHIIEPPPVIHQRTKHAFNGKPVIATRLSDAQEFFFESERQAERELNLRMGAVKECLTGRQKQSGGYVFCKAAQQNHVFATSIDDWNQRYAFPTQKAAYQALKIHHMAPSEALTGRKLTGAGYFWSNHELSQDEWEERVRLLHTHFRTNELLPPEQKGEELCTTEQQTALAK